MYNVFNHSNYYVQTGNANNASGLLSDVYLTNGTAATAPNGLPVPNGTPEFVDGNGNPLSYTIMGKKGTPQGYLTSPGSIDRRFIQFALKLTF
jgi:hypothetical protein